jgi:hypothetical protein
MIPDYVEKYIVRPLTDIEESKSLVAEVDDYKLGEFKNYHSLIPMAQSALKPVFELNSADGVVGGHHEYVRNCQEDFEKMASTLKQRVDNL